MPSHIAVGDQLTVDIATDLRVPPAVVDVDNADHVPLKNIKNTFRNKQIHYLHVTIHKLKLDSPWAPLKVRFSPNLYVFSIENCSVSIFSSIIW